MAGSAIATMVASRTTTNCATHSSAIIPGRERGGGLAAIPEPYPD